MNSTGLYKSNPNLKSVGVAIQFTQQEACEYLRCKTDYIYFIRNYIKIISLDNGLINFDLYEYQENFLHEIHNNRKVISMQARQMGKTQTVAAYLTWYALFNDNKTVAVLANKAAAARQILSRIKLMIEHLPKWMQQGITEWNKGSVRFENNTRIFAAATAPSGIRGDSCVTKDTQVCIKQHDFVFFTKISDILENDFFDTEKMKILSSEGFKSFEGFVCQGISESLFKVSFVSERSIKATGNHRFLMENKEYKECKDLQIGDKLSGDTVSSIEQIENELVYDAVNVEDVHNYYTNGVISHNCNFLYIDEVSIIPATVADAFFTATYPTIFAGTTTKIVLTSTPLGLNHFWKFWTEAENKINGFKPVKVEYHQHPNRDEKWAAEQRKLLGDLKFNQEVLCSFHGSSTTLIETSVLQRLATKRPIYEQNNLLIYQDPETLKIPDEPEPQFLILVDTSAGVGGDANAFSVIRIDKIPYELVAVFRDNKISPLIFPSIIHRVALKFNKALVLVEINSTEQIAHILRHEIDYENILYVAHNKKHGQHISIGSKASAGIRMDRRTKRIGCSMLKDLIEQNKLMIHDYETIYELSSFIQHPNGTYSAEDGFHDDLVMPLVMFGWLTQDAYFQDLTNIEIRKKLFEQRLQTIEDDMLPIGFLVNGIDDPANPYPGLETGEKWENWGGGVIAI